MSVIFLLLLAAKLKSTWAPLHVTISQLLRYRMCCTRRAMNGRSGAGCPKIAPLFPNLTIPRKFSPPSLVLCKECASSVHYLPWHLLLSSITAIIVTLSRYTLLLCAKIWELFLWCNIFLFLLRVTIRNW